MLLWHAREPAALGQASARVVHDVRDGGLLVVQPSVTLVGGELAEPEVPVKIGKAAKKNMKRLEKRAKERAATDTSVASSDIVSDMYPETTSEADNEGESPSETRAGEEVSSLLRSDSREDGNGESFSGSDGLDAQAGDHPRCIQAWLSFKAAWGVDHLPVHQD